MIQRPLNLSDYDSKVDSKLDSNINKNDIVVDKEKDKELKSLLLTSKELKIIRRKAREEKQKQKEIKEQEQDDEIEDDDNDVNDVNDNVEYERIKSKLDNIKELELDLPPIEPEQSQIPPRTVQNSQNTPNLQQSITVMSNSSVPNLIQPRQSHEAGRVIQNQVSSPPMDDSGDVDLNKLFSSEVGNESDVVKELFTQDNIKVKTDISPNEISIISRLELQASMTQNFFLTKVLKELEVLRVSKNRMSRGEFVQSFSGIRESNSGATAFGKLSGIFKNDKV